MLQPAQTFSSGYVAHIHSASDGERKGWREVAKRLLLARQPSTADVLSRLDPHLQADIGIAPGDLARH